jgi:hypothetical protein
VTPNWISNFEKVTIGGSNGGNRAWTEQAQAFFWIPKNIAMFCLYFKLIWKKIARLHTTKDNYRILIVNVDAPIIST